MYSTAITRKPCQNFSSGLTKANLGEPDYFLMLDQHNTYVSALKQLGLEIVELDALDDFPDAHFVEDTAVVLPELAIITRPGAASRRGEEISVEKELSKYRNIKRIQKPGTLDGGDVLVAARDVFIGISDRTNKKGTNQLLEILKPFNYNVSFVEVQQGLHLKSDVNYIGNNTLLLTSKYYDIKYFKDYEKILVEDDEAYAANSLLINNTLLIPKGYKKAKNKLKNTGFSLIELDMSESQKMDGGLTCLSLRY